MTPLVAVWARLDCPNLNLIPLLQQSCIEPPNSNRMMISNCPSEGLERTRTWSTAIASFKQVILDVLFASSLHQAIHTQLFRQRIHLFSQLNLADQTSLATLQPTKPSAPERLHSSWSISTPIRTSLPTIINDTPSLWRQQSRKISSSTSPASEWSRKCGASGG